MRGKSINQFMWGYQSHYRANIRLRTAAVLKQIGIDVEPTVILIGVRKENAASRHAVCIEPEDERWTPSMFEGIDESIRGAYDAHPEHMMLYGDEARMRDKPENILRSCISHEVRAAVEKADNALGFRTLSSIAFPYADYRVVCLIQLPEEIFAQSPTITYHWRGEDRESSFLLCCLHEMLTEAVRGLMSPEPGRYGGSELRPAGDIVRAAAANFLYVPVIDGEHVYSDLFAQFNLLSQQLYEGRAGIGRLILAQAGNPDVDFWMQLAESVPLRQTRWVRKLLQMTGEGIALIANYQSVLGLARFHPHGPPLYHVEFVGKHEWDFNRGREILMRVTFGEARLATDLVPRARFIDNLQRLFPNVSDEAVERHRTVLDQMVQQIHGSMLLVAVDAKAEAVRLESQGTRITPQPLTAELFASVSQIDGTIIVDPEGLCYAVGVILDGAASENCTPSRGARYNSAIRYVAHGSAQRLALVYSDDRSLDVVPLLPPRVRRAVITDAIEALWSADIDTYHHPRNLLEKHRFYLDAEQCERANAAMERIYATPAAVGEIRLVHRPFEPHPDMNDSFLLE